jgi:hypothetical protein
MPTPAPYNTPDFCFILYLLQYRSPVTELPLAICTNPGIPKGYSPSTLFSYVYTGKSNSISIGKTLDSNPSDFAEIPVASGVFSQGSLLSGELSGTSYRLNILTYNIPAISSVLTVSETTISRGVVGQVTDGGSSYKIELVNKNDRLTKQERFVTNDSCMNGLGKGKCAFSVTSQTRTVVSVTNGNTFTISPPITLTPNYQYSLIIGTRRYVVDTPNSTTTSLRIIGRIQGKPNFVRVEPYCNLTYAQCQIYGQLTKFNGIPFLQSEGRNINL